MIPNANKVKLNYNSYNKNKTTKDDLKRNNPFKHYNN